MLLFVRRLLTSRSICKSDDNEPHEMHLLSPSSSSMENLTFEPCSFCKGEKTSRSRRQYYINYGLLLFNLLLATVSVITIFLTVSHSHSQKSILKQGSFYCAMNPGIYFRHGLTEYSTDLRPLRYSNTCQNHERQFLRHRFSINISAGT